MIDYTPQPGDLYLTAFGGFNGAWITFGQWLARDPSRYTHAGVFLGDGLVLSAQPSGARIDAVETVLNDRPLAILRVPEWAEHRRPSIVQIAHTFEGHAYGFESFLWVACVRFGVQPRWLRRLVESERGLICSALVDRVWNLAGIHLFDDGRLPGEVTPGDLAHVGEVLHVGTGPFDGWSH